MVTSERPARQPRSAIERGLALLEQLACSRRPQSFTALNEALGGISRATLARLLRALQQSGHVVKDRATGLYRCGGRMGVFAAVRTSGRAELLVERYEPLMQRIAREHAVSVILQERVGHALVCIKRVATESSAVMQEEGHINREMDQPWGLLLAAYDESVAATVADPHLRRRHPRIRADGFVYDDQTLRRNFRRLGFPLLDRANRLIGAFGLGGSILEITDANLDRLVAGIRHELDRLGPLDG
ncbi:MAG: helix-turn-helix domain-containing protein [Kiritimatiellae bacterium]|nr:helix-turn-helix domain-containing protein [Kiritimatiellia bacterium]